MGLTLNSRGLQQTKEDAEYSPFYPTLPRNHAVVTSPSMPQKMQNIQGKTFSFSLQVNKYKTRSLKDSSHVSSDDISAQTYNLNNIC